MAIGNTPTMFVSSTCFDLGQVRADIKNFLESLGIEPILSEFDSFPVNPDVKAVDNCLKVVDENADILLLIVGGRYGSIIDEDKSVTNMEYLRAIAKGIPVYIFVKQSILNNLPIWKDNKAMDFKSVVDSPKLFEFITSIMEVNSKWVFPFESANDIIGTLRKQLGYLFMDALQLRRRFKTNGLSEPLSQLQGMPLRFVIDRPVAWEYRLFTHVLDQEISRVKHQRLDLTYGITLGSAVFLSDRKDVFRWLSKKMAEVERIASAINQITNVALQDALAPDGVPANPEMLVYVAKRLALTYEYAIQWAMECNQVGVGDKEFEKIVRLTGKLVDNMLSEIEDFSERILKDTEEAVLNLPLKGEEQKVLHFTLKVTVPDMPEYYQEMDRLRDLFK